MMEAFMLVYSQVEMTASFDYGNTILATVSRKPAGMPIQYGVPALALTVVSSYLVETAESSTFGKFLSSFIYRTLPWSYRWGTRSVSCWVI